MRIPPKTGVVDIPADGATDNVALTDLKCSSVTLQAPAGNAGKIYIGGSDVTNASGANIGIELLAGDAISNLYVDNLNHIYAAADTAGDDVRFLIV